MIAAAVHAHQVAEKKQAELPQDSHGRVSPWRAAGRRVSGWGRS
jgi:hypothetical protein